MAKFNITRIVPEGFIHTSGFLEVIDSLAWSLSSLGHEVNVTQNWFSESRETNIIFGAEVMADFTRLPPKTIVFNLEQPSHPRLEVVRRIIRESNAIVWDYSMRSVADWRERGFPNVRHVPIGYTPNLTRIPHSDPDIDVLFYGWMTPRREAVIRELRSAGLKVVATSACYGGGRDNLISRAKVVLNVHHDDRDRFEIVRCSYLMANSKAILTEVSSDDDEYSDLDRGLARYPYRILADSVSSLVCSEVECERLEEQAMTVIRRRDFSLAVSTALDAPYVSASAPVSPAVVDTRQQFALGRAAQKREYMEQGRSLADKSKAAVQFMYRYASYNGDMKDFMLWLHDNARGNVVEIGTRGGASTSAFLSGVEDRGGHVYSIDIDPRCGELFKGHPQWTFIQGDSREVSTLQKVPSGIDLLLIDGDHSDSGVRSDFAMYSPLVRPGGLIVFHDIAPEPNPGNIPDWPDDSVKNFYAELCAAGWQHEELPGRYGMGVLTKPVVVAPPMEMQTK